MNINSIKILIPIVFCCYTCAFLELDFGGDIKQTWHDEFDSYTLNSKVTSSKSHSFSVNSLVDLFAETADNFFIPKLSFVRNICINNQFDYLVSRLYIKNEALLI